MGRKIFAVLAGLLVAVGTFLLAEALNYPLHPALADAATQARHGATKAPEEIPFSFWLVVLAGWLAGSLLAGFVVRKVSNASGYGLPLITGIVLTLAGVANLFALSHPGWFAVCSVLIFIPSVFAGHCLHAGRTS